jgi:hypothetical protein
VVSDIYKGEDFPQPEAEVIFAWIRTPETEGLSETVLGRGPPRSAARSVVVPTFRPFIVYATKPSSTRLFNSPPTFLTTPADGSKAVEFAPPADALPLANIDVKGSSWVKQTGLDRGTACMPGQTAWQPTCLTLPVSFRREAGKSISITLLAPTFRTVSLKGR